MNNQKDVSVEDKLFCIFEEIEQLHLSVDSYDDYLTGIYQLINSYLHIDNFYIVLDRSDQLDYLQVIQKNQQLVIERYSQLMPDQGVSPIAWVIFQRLEKIFIKTDPQWGTQNGIEQWLGFPMLDKQGRCFGALVIENDHCNLHYTESQISTLRVIASYINFGVGYWLDSVVNSAMELENAQVLKQQIQESTHAEKLQQVLYEIASLANAQIPLHEMYQKIHQNIDKIIDARNFCIASYEEGEMTFSYVVDQEGGEQHLGQTFPVGDGLNSYVVRTCQSTMFTQSNFHKLLKEGRLWNVMGGTDFSCWIGAPIIYEGVMYGVISVQSYIDYSNILYTQADLDLLEFIAGHVAAVMQAHRKSDQLRKTRTELMRKYLIEEQQNEQLVTALKELKETQLKVVHREKMMSLGGVVAGIAHEINTPLGTCITSVSHSENINIELQQSLVNKRLSVQQLRSYAEKRQQAVHLIDHNMQKIEKLMSQFKDMTTEHSEERITKFDLNVLLEQAVDSMQAVLAPAGHRINLVCPEGLIIKTVQSAIQRIVFNMCLNSIHHAYQPDQKGCLRLSIEEQGPQIVLRYSDGGKGMTQADLDKLFDPFFTTKRSVSTENLGTTSSSTGLSAGGLGAHQIYHLAVTTLAGELQVTSRQDLGLYYKISFPAML
jgi:signal transduction histidine kinase